MTAGLSPYRTLRDRAARTDLDGCEIAVASPDDLLAVKRAAGRRQDLVDIEALEIARGLRGS